MFICGTGRSHAAKDVKRTPVLCALCNEARENSGCEKREGKEGEGRKRTATRIMPVGRHPMLFNILCVSEATFTTKVSLRAP